MAIFETQVDDNTPAATAASTTKNSSLEFKIESENKFLDKWNDEIYLIAWLSNEWINCARTFFVIKWML